MGVQKNGNIILWAFAGDAGSGAIPDNGRTRAVQTRFLILGDTGDVFYYAGAR